MYYINKNGKGMYRKEPKFCSLACNSKNNTKKQWSDESHRKKVSEKNRQSMLKQYKDKSRKPNTKAARKALYKNGRISKDQVAMFDVIKKVYKDAEIEYSIGKYVADVAIPSIKTVIEWDGGGHWISVYKNLKTMPQKIEEDKARDMFMNDLGWHVIRYNEETGYNSCLEDIRRVSLNSTEGYSFNEVAIKQIVKVNKKHVSKKAKLYDITVKDEESFVIMGVISHNCTLTYLTPGFGFNDKGLLEYISKDFDQYAEQK
jgi:very-short-patch-repair endonuclease